MQCYSSIRDIVLSYFLIKNFSDKLPLYEKGGIMQIALPNTQTFEKKEPLYTNEELHLLHQLENGLVKSTSHEDVMKNLKQVLKLDEI